MLVTPDSLRAALTSACPGVRIASVRALDAGHTSRQLVAETDALHHLIENRLAKAPAGLLPPGTGLARPGA